MMFAKLRRSPIYVTVSVVCVLFNNVLLIWLDRLSVYYAVSVIISAAVMIPLSFVLHSRFTFAVEPSALSFWRYASVQIVNTPAAWLLLLIIHDKGGVPMIYAAPIVTFILFVWNFAGSGWAMLAGGAQVRQKERP
jgi:putative flippase GtrA